MDRLRSLGCGLKRVLLKEEVRTTLRSIRTSSGQDPHQVGAGSSLPFERTGDSFKGRYGTAPVPYLFYVTFGCRLIWGALANSRKHLLRWHECFRREIQKLIGTGLRFAFSGLLAFRLACFFFNRPFSDCLRSRSSRLPLCKARTGKLTLATIYPASIRRSIRSI